MAVKLLAQKRIRTFKIQSPLQLKLLTANYQQNNS